MESVSQLFHIISETLISVIVWALAKKNICVQGFYMRNGERVRLSGRLLTMYSISAQFESAGFSPRWRCRG